MLQAEYEKKPFHASLTCFDWLPVEQVLYFPDYKSYQSLLFNELPETVDLGFSVCRQFLTHRCLCSDKEPVALHEAVTPRRPACRVISIYLLGK